MPYFIYALADPRTDVVRYVGITDNAYARYKQHASGYDLNRQKNAWMQQLKKERLLPSLKILETVETLREARSKERYWIRFYVDQGVILTNIALNRPKPIAKPIPEKAIVDQFVYQTSQPVYQIPQGEEIMTIDEVKSVLDISKTTVYKLIKEGFIRNASPKSPLLKRSYRLTFRRSEIQQFLDDGGRKSVPRYKSRIQSAS